nr:ankyrin repeat and KH domain containing protein [Hymenolepis microstoma]
MAEPPRTLHEAILKNDTESVRNQLENNISPNVFPNEPRITPLILAVRLKFHGILILLLQYGANVGGVDILGKTALHYAVDMNDVDSVFILVFHNCPLDILDNFNISPLTLAIWRNNIQMVRYLVANGAVVYARLEIYPVPPLTFAVFLGRLDILKFLLTVEEENIMRKATNLHYALCVACDGGQIEAVRYLIDCGAQVDRWSPDVESPLEIAILRDHEEIVSLLLSRHASVNDHDFAGYTPLMHAVIHDNLSAVAQLLWYGADPDEVRNGTTETAERMAMDMERETIVQMFFFWKYEVITSMTGL